MSSCYLYIAEMFDNADFRVNVDSKQWGTLLHTQMINSQCREPGSYTVIPKSFIEDLLLAREYYGEDLGEITKCRSCLLIYSSVQKKPCETKATKTSHNDKIPSNDHSEW